MLHQTITRLFIAFLIALAISIALTGTAEGEMCRAGDLLERTYR